MRFRFTIRDLLWLTALIAMGLAWWVDHQRLLFELRGYGGPLTAGQGYEKCATFTQAVQLAQGQLAQDGKREYAALLTEGRVRAAIETAIKSVDATLDEDEQRSPGTKEYWQQIVKPVYLQISNNEEWPEGCSFEGFYSLSDTPRGTTYDGLGLRLTVKTPKSKFQGYSLPILDLFFGRGGR